jgi:hypothetical protein
MFREGGSYNYGTTEVRKFWNYSLVVFDQIQINIPHDRLSLYVYGYDIRSIMKPSLIGENFIVFKISEGVL